jgi:DMSO/TMAO reductase YedYZ molybdopterin-dependent catalytic subunit
VSRAPATLPLALAGVAAGVAGLATSQALVWAFDGGDSPLVAVGLAVRDLTPGSIAVTLVETVRHLDKPLLVAGTTVVFLLICAAAGVLSRRNTLWSDAIFVVLAVVGLLSVLRLDNATSIAGFSVLLALVTWIVVLRFLTAPMLSEGARLRAVAEDPDARRAWVLDEPAPDSRRPARRDVLVRSGAIVAGSVVLGLLGRWSGRGLREVERARRLLRLPVTRGAVPKGARADLEGTPPWRTPNDRFYLIDTTLSAPTISPKDWSLRIHGMVDQELTLSYEDLINRQLTEAWVTLCCVSNEVGGDLIGNAWWSGGPVRELLAEAGVDPSADAVKQTSSDGWTCGTPLSALTDGRNALLAVAMNGHPLPIRHGFPVRMVVPGLYGYVSATKWLVDLEVTRFDRFDAYWTRRGWSERGPVKTQSRIDVPRDGATVKAGAVRVGGSAWSQHTGIAKVEFQLDGGPWREAELGAVPDADTWVQWAGTVDVERGSHRLVVRATDRSGSTQTSVRTDVVPDGASGWHDVEFSAE